MAFIKQEKKADPKWLPAIWRGKAVSNHTHIVSDRGVILVTRSTRRLADAFSLEMCGDRFWTLGSRVHSIGSQTGGLVPAVPYPGPGTDDDQPAHDLPS